jgi:hypothetical protein
MPYMVILHIQGEEPVLAEAEEIPSANDFTIRVNHPRRVDGKDLPYIAENVITVIWPMARINFIEILPTREEEEIIGFFRE